MPSRRLPRISAGAWRPCAEDSAYGDDLADVIAVVRDELPQESFECAGDLLVSFVSRFDMTGEFVRRRFCECGCDLEQLEESVFQYIPITRIGRTRRRRKTFGIVFRIRQWLAMNALQVIVHPVIHVEDDLADGVRKSGDVVRGKVYRKIFNAPYWIGMCSFAVQQFGEGGV
jgi:hypothetical protein